MANFDDVTTNEHIQAIADAVRRVTRSNASMTIPEIAAILGTLNLVEVREVEVSIEPGMTTLYGVTSYDTTIKHLFLFFPKDYVAGKVFGDIAPTVVVQESGYIDFTLARAHAEGDIKSVVMLDFLISDEATTKGYFIQNMDYAQILENAVNGIPVKSGQGVSSVVSKTGVYGADNVAGGVATGFQAVALGGMRPDKLDDPGRTPTSAEGIQSFAAGGCTHAYGDFSVALGKDTKAYMRGSAAIGGGAEAGMTVSEFNDLFATAEQKATPGYDRTKVNGGIEGMSIVDSSAEHYEYPHSYSFAFAIGQDSKAKGRVSFAAGNNNQAYGWYSFVVNSLNVVNSAKGSAFGDSNVLYDAAEGAFVKGKRNEGYSSFGDSGGYNNVIGNDLGIVDYPNGPTSQAERTFRAIEYPAHNTPAGVGAYSVVRGLGNEVYAKGCVVTGVQNYTDADMSFISGYRNIVRAASLSGLQTDLYYAHVFGGTNYVHGNARYSFTAGSDNDVSGNQSAAIGKQHVVENDRAVCLNAYNISGRSAQTVVGQYNLQSTTGMFVVGNGSSTSNRKNALVVHYDGRTTLGAAPTEAMDAATKGYVDNALSDYVQKTYYANANRAGLVKANTGYGIGVEYSGDMYLVTARDGEVKSGANSYHPVTPLKQHLSVFYGLARAAGVNLASSTEETAPNGVNPGIYPEAAKTAIKNMLGVKKIYKHVVSFTIDVTAYSGMRGNSGAVFYSSSSTQFTAEDILENMGATWFPISGYTTNASIFIAIASGRYLYFFSAGTAGSPTYVNISAASIINIVDTVTEV